MSEHAKHLVSWGCVAAKSYRLYCLTCGEYTSYETQAPNQLGLQRFEQAMSEPEKVSVTLKVQSLRHKRRTQEF